jgi:hypothetical protein
LLITTRSVEFSHRPGLSPKRESQGDCNMLGGLSLRHRVLIAAAIALMGSFAHEPVKAADLGGDCCADLEERIAELEATTVRKGNKKVSVTL